jgi:large subunit ribosomal protein L29
MKNTENFSAISLEELKTRLVTEQESYVKLKFAHAVTPLENPMRIRENRRTIARIQTAIRAKELGKS